METLTLIGLFAGTQRIPYNFENFIFQFPNSFDIPLIPLTYKDWVYQENLLSLNRVGLGLVSTPLIGVTALGITHRNNHVARICKLGGGYNIR